MRTIKEQHKSRQVLQLYLVDTDLAHLFEVEFSGSASAFSSPASDEISWPHRQDPGRPDSVSPVADNNR